MNKKINTLIMEQAYYYDKVIETGNVRLMNTWHDIDKEINELVEKRARLAKIIRTEYVLVELVGNDVATIIVEYIFSKAN